MIQREFRLVCRGIQLISVFELEEFSKNPTMALLLKEDSKTLLPTEKKETLSFEEPLKDKIY